MLPCHTQQKHKSDSEHEQNMRLFNRQVLAARALLHYLLPDRSDSYLQVKSDVVEERSTVLSILERSRARSSGSVCCEWCDWRRPWFDVLCCSPHCDIVKSCLTNDTLITFVRVLSATTTDTSRHRPFAARPTMPAVRFRRCRLPRRVPKCQLLAASRYLHCLVTFSFFILCYSRPFPYCTC